MAVLFTRVEDDMHAQVKKVAALAHVSVTILMEVILTERMGQQHPLSAAVRRAFREHRKGHPQP